MTGPKGNDAMSPSLRLLRTVDKQPFSWASILKSFVSVILAITGLLGINLPSGPTTPATTVAAYPVPTGASADTDFVVSAGGKAVGIFDAGANAWGSHIGFGTFDFSGGPVTVGVTVGFAFSTYALAPDSLGLTSSRSGQIVTFTLTKPTDVSLIFDGDRKAQTLHLFAQSPDPAAPSPSDPNVIYYAAGYHEDKGDPIVLGTGKTLYLAPGAVLKARVRVVDAAGAAIRGHGVLVNDYNSTTNGDNVAIAVVNSTNVTIDGLTTNRSVGSWTGFISESSAVNVTNYHVVSPTYASTDGFDIGNSHDVTFDNVFIRSCDDSVSIKGNSPHGYDPLYDPANATPNYNILYKNSQLWSDANNAIVVGEESIASRYQNIRFENIDILQSFDDVSHPDQLTDRAAMTVLMLNATTMSDITFDNIRVEDCRRLINVDMRNSFWFGSIVGNLGWPGSISGVTFSNVTSTCAGSSQIRMNGWDASHRISDITLKNVKVNGSYVAGQADPHLQINSLVSNVTFVTPSGTATLANGPVNIAAADDYTADTYDAAHDYTPQQGNQGWTYQTWKAGVGFAAMTWDTTLNRWRGTGTYDAVWPGDGTIYLHPDNDQVLVNWTAPRAGTVTITGTAKKFDTSGGDGVNVSIWHNDTNFWPGAGAWQAIAYNDSTGYSVDQTLTVAAGDVISFRLDEGGNISSDSTAWSPRITYTS